MGAFAPSLLEWLGSSKAMALQILQSPPPGYVSPVAMRAQVWEWVPFIAIAWDHMLAGYLIHVFDECQRQTERYSGLPGEGNKQHEQRASVHMHIIMREYIC